MAGLAWILTLLCAAGCHLSSASPAPPSPLVVQAGQNASLTCNLTSSGLITWFLLRSDQLLILLTVQSGLTDVVDYNAADSDRVQVSGFVDSGLVGLEILQVEDKDAGLYFCTGTCAGAVCVDRVIRLHVAPTGADGDPARQPCWTLGICVLPASVVLCVVIMAAVYLCSGKPAVCCCNSPRGGAGLQLSEEELHYSSLQLTDKPRPPGHGERGLADMQVTYSAVATRKHPNRSHDHR